MEVRPICRIEQPFGLGDICFIQKLIDRVIGDGYDVQLPVIRAYSWLGDYIQKDHLHIFPVDIHPSLESKLPPAPEGVFNLPLRNSMAFYPGMPVIASKYHMLRMNYENWQDHFTFKRFREKEESLRKRVCPEGEFCLVSRMIRSPPESRPIRFPIETSLPIIDVSSIDGFTPFDWASVFEAAREIYIVDSAFTFICEKLRLRAKKMVIVSRAHEQGGVHESLMTLHMFKQPWVPLLPPEF